jgi:hypothetical protein
MSGRRQRDLRAGAAPLSNSLLTSAVVRWKTDGATSAAALVRASSSSSTKESEMERVAHSVFSEELESLEAGRSAGDALLAEFGATRPKVVIAFATMNHDQPALLEGLRAALGKDVPVLGCSVQGVVSNDQLTEDGLALGLMGFGGADVHCAAAFEREIQTDSKEKGRHLAQSLKRELQGDVRSTWLHLLPSEWYQRCLVFEPMFQSGHLVLLFFQPEPV